MSVLSFIIKLFTFGAVDINAKDAELGKLSKELSKTTELLDSAHKYSKELAIELKVASERETDLKQRLTLATDRLTQAKYQLPEQKVVKPATKQAGTPASKQSATPATKVEPATQPATKKRSRRKPKSTTTNTIHPPLHTSDGSSSNMVDAILLHTLTAPVYEPEIVPETPSRERRDAVDAPAPAYEQPVSSWSSSSSSSYSGSSSSDYSSSSSSDSSSSSSSCSSGCD